MNAIGAEQLWFLLLLFTLDVVVIRLLYIAVAQNERKYGAVVQLTTNMSVGEVWICAAPSSA